MRPFLFAVLMGMASVADARPVLAQTVDRYGGVGAYAAPVRASASAAPVRVLSWPGKSIPSAAPPQAARGYAGQGQTPPGYAPAPQASYPGQVYGPQVQPNYAAAPGAPAPTPGSTATAPNGVYPPNTVPPQFAYPIMVPPTAAPVVNGPPLPTSIYAPPQAAADARPSRPMAVAAAAPAQGARLYSLHREFGLQPDPTPPLPADDGQAVELVSSIDSGGARDPAADSATTIRTRQTDSSGKTVTRTAQLRGASDSDN